MSALWLGCLLAYSLQLTVLVVSALCAAHALRLRAPAPALLFWRGVLLATLIVPFVPWNFALGLDAKRGSVRIIASQLAGAALPWYVTDVAAALMGVAAAGAGVRTAWLVIGLFHIRAVRRSAQPLRSTPGYLAEIAARLGTRADFCTCDDVDGPVTIGWRHPIVLLPPRVLTLPIAVQQAILCHELVHVRRRDWADMLGEELWRGLLWFHPAAHLLVARISLMREALVDQQTLALTSDRRAYAEALLAFATPAPRVPVAASTLIRVRHLSHRIALIAQEVHMSHRHIVASLGVGALVVAAATAASAARFPITAPWSDGLARDVSVAADQEPAMRPGNGVTAPRVIRKCGRSTPPRPCTQRFKATWSWTSWC